MADSENRFLDEIPVGLWVGLAPEGQVVYTNAAFREIMAMPAVTESRIGDAPTTYGQISLHDRPGGGALFRVELPVAEPPASEHRPPPTVGSRATSRWQVLVIDDDPRVAGMLAAQLKRAGMRVQVVTDGAAAPAVLLSEAEFNLIYCDLMMGGMTGMDLAELLRARAPQRLAQTVFMTGGAFTPRAAAFIADHPDNCVEKPFDVVAETRRRLGEIGGR
jgi:CheY-like chemotaxis protein